ncbi:16S rRNA (guanine(966)-N(2))-methyltransferase RsmD [Tahibacter amnicola]|uniref:Ribosomal RNA small subunit methyltransferase D n=1 Tax=Tahibacter amnicola TaxID=2976241 RepID=A0ABY6BD35_9GAMM|nr:16S rRNA (guanine(966)-N(2))-methyltransferase RsmD [Tahibacter amnicola]UXI67486.1 16S rRNA (guanine(966)-N(2))-methyltransferase RsmD [Tahibacter amnicola]
MHPACYHRRYPALFSNADLPPNSSGKVRIIGGTLRNSRLDVPLRPGLRPTTDRVRETLFNWLMGPVGGARCLDLFAGTGALGIEALSRHAREVVFVERDPALAAALRGNLERLRQSAGRVVVGDALGALAGESGPFDIVFLDPPFDLLLWDPVIERLESGGYLAPHALIYVESPIGVTPAVPPGWMLHREGKAGEVRYALYRRGTAMP